MTEPVTITLPAVATPEATEALVDALRKAGDTPLHLVASAVQQMSTPSVLTLTSAVRSRPDGAVNIRVEKATSAFTDAFSDLGLFSDLMKMEFVS